MKYVERPDSARIAVFRDDGVYFGYIEATADRLQIVEFDPESQTSEHIVAAALEPLKVKIGTLADQRSLFR